MPRHEAECYTIGGVILLWAGPPLVFGVVTGVQQALRFPRV